MIYCLNKFHFNRTVGLMELFARNKSIFVPFSLIFLIYFYGDQQKEWKQYKHDIWNSKMASVMNHLNIVYVIYNTEVTPLSPKVG